MPLISPTRISTFSLSDYVTQESSWSCGVLTKYFLKMPKAFLFIRCGSHCLTFSRSSFSLFSMHLLMPTKHQREKYFRFLCAPRRKGHRLCYRIHQNKRLKHMGISLPGLSLEGTLFLEKDTILCQCVEPAWHSRENCVCSIFSLRTLSSLLASEADAVVFRAESKGKCFKKILKINYLSGKVKSSVYLFAKRTTKSL